MNLFWTTIMLAYHLAHWDTLYETPETRRIRKLTYYAKPNNTVGECIGYMLSQPDGLALYGTFTFVLEGLASTAPTEWRGWLVRNGSTMDAKRMSHLTHIPQETIQRALEFFSTPPMDWLEHIEWPESKQGTPSPLPAAARLSNGRSMGTPSDHPAESLLAPIRGKQDKERKDDSLKDTHTIAPGAPLESEVKAWATQVGVPPEFALLKLAQAGERKDFDKKFWREGWQSKVQRFWSEDGEAWIAKNQKKRGAPGGHPNGWQAGDAEQWWSDPLPEVRATLSGAVMMKDEKNAARLREVIAAREKGKR